MSKVFIPDLKPVKSSSIKAVAFDTNDLYVQFKNDRVYVYKSVPEELYNNLMKAESKGKFLNENIVKKDFNYDYLR